MLAWPVLLMCSGVDGARKLVSIKALPFKLGLLGCCCYRSTMAPSGEHHKNRLIELQLPLDIKPF